MNSLKTRRNESFANGMYGLSTNYGSTIRTGMEAMDVHVRPCNTNQTSTQDSAGALVTSVPASFKPNRSICNPETVVVSSEIMNNFGEVR